MEKIALIVPTYAENPETIQRKIDEHKHGLHDDTYKHHSHLLDILLRQIQEYGYFKIYVYLTKKKRKEWSRRGSGKVDYVYYVDKIKWENNKKIPCPDKKLATDDHIGNHLGEEPTRCWNYVYKISPNPLKKEKTLDKNWEDFHLYPSKKTSKVQGMLNDDAHWYYVYDDF